MASTLSSIIFSLVSSATLFNPLLSINHSNYNGTYYLRISNEPELLHFENYIEIIQFYYDYDDVGDDDDDADEL